ncbi:Sal-like protein 3 MSal Spalt-like protein 3 [Larimichthys crocea]|uniref:Sal-like protein 3 MSal Spalt-like protein 3 n=1 Tax=Larimichthys crocea TaxID=215358 RepID=A0A6G0HU18_LARCR|nr:Sal-like protein 3 MSal Spalt-like protein 3 [Larimichthys crocea]
MSRRKQAKPQHLKSDEEAHTRSGLLCNNGIVEGMEREESSGGCHSSEETHICDKCCAEFFSWTELSEHQKVCTEDPLVLIVKDNERMPVPEESPIGPSPVPSVASSDSSAAESTDAGFDLGETLMSAAGSYSMPSTNVTLEILHSTRVAVAQFSQGINSCGTGGKAASAAIPVILEHLLALQQQQVHQLQLIEQICSQVAIMNRQPTQAALNPVSRSLSLAPNPFPFSSNPAAIRNDPLNRQWTGCCFFVLCA